MQGSALTKAAILLARALDVRRHDLMELFFCRVGNCHLDPDADHRHRAYTSERRASEIFDVFVLKIRN